MTRDFTKRQRKILDLILRLSWGCGKKDAFIPRQSDFSVVGIHEVDIKRELNWLAVSKVIIREEQFYWFNKDFDQWEVSRVKPYLPEKLSELLRLNLNGNRPELSKTLSQLSETLSKNLVKHEEKGYLFTKFPTPDSASSKEIERNNNESNIYRVYPFTTEEDPEKKLSKTLSLAGEIWGKACGILQTQVNPANFTTWLASTSGLAFAEGRFWLGVPSIFVAEYLVENQRSLIEKVLVEVTGEETELVFCLAPPEILPEKVQEFPK